jgi:heat shock protein HtpX
MARRGRGDWGLRGRMFITIGLLVALYLGFLTYLSAQGVGLVPLMAIAAVMLGFQYFFSARLAMWGMKAKVVSPEEAPELHAMVDRLARDAGIRKPKVAISRLPVPNAFATGRGRRSSVVAATEGLLNQLEPREVEAVMAHEVHHIVNRDVLVMTLASFFAMVAMFMMRSFFFGSLFGGGRRGGGGQGSAPILVMYIVSFAVYIISQILIMALSRYREFAADRGAAHLTGRPQDLASALVKISGGMQRLSPQQKEVLHSMNAFFIIPTSFKEIFSSHPTLEKRLDNLSKVSRELGLSA